MKKIILALGALLLLTNCSDEFSNDIEELKTEKSGVLSEENVNHSDNKATTRLLNQISTNDWLNNVADDTKLIDLSLVGTHDAGAYVTGGGLAICQQNDIKTQLNAGVRYLDIRLNAFADREDLQVYHGIISQNLSWEKDVYKPISDFLDKNPSEFVFVVLKNESGKDENLWRQKLLTSLANKADKVLAKINQNTTLKEARGKMIVLNRSYLENNYNPMSGIRYNNIATNATLNGNPMYFSDVFKVSTLFPSHIQSKFNVIKQGIESAKKNDFVNHYMIINANGTSIFAYPRYVANRINPMISNYITNNQLINNSNQKRLGYLVLDFATSDKGREVINLWVKKTINSFGK